MTSSKNTKRALLASVLSVALCCAMLIGSTFAWFTDSVTNTGNRIQAGNLEIDLLMDKAGNGTYTSIADGEGDIFNEAQIAQNSNETLWEPGKTQIVYLGVQNKGSLALKYNILLDVTDNGLAGALEYAVLDGAQASDLADVTDWEALKAMGGAQTGDIAAGRTTAAPNGCLDEIANGTQDETDYFALAVHMKEDADNEYQDKDITIDVTVVATQATAEEDGFGNDDYDAGATFGETIEVGNDATSLEEAMNTPFVPVEINVTENISNGGTLEVTGDVTMNLGKNMIHNYTSAITGADIDVKDGGKLTINAEANSYGFDYTAGKLAASGNGSALTVNGGRYGDSGSGNSDVTAENGAAVTINSGIFSTSGYQGHAVMATSGGTMYINGGSYSSSGAQSVVIYADGGTIYVEGFDNLTANGRKFGVANDGIIYISKTASPSEPTSIASGCKVTEEVKYWVISAE